ncbi:signal peptidase I [Enterococcus faecium]|uniref:signal peptidase I n=1 Tax=Enterococcus faecium TaxID=1352 RepID=UPI0027B3FE27|nr:signal peptidase I [Enterococcus faecium]MDQ2047174.1 signal peptidase I [Enterococcus faecium]
MKEFLKNWGILILVLAAILLARVYVFTPVTVNGHSMDPTLSDGQRLISSKISNYERMDIITTKEPGDEERMIVKRIIGMPGDTVKMENDQLTINGKKYDEPYLDEFKKEFSEDKLQGEYAYNSGFQAQAESSSTFTSDFEYTVPKGKYLVLGDNRLISKDSRMFGLVDKDMIQGKVVFRYWPLSEIKIM